MTPEQIESRRKYQREYARRRRMDPEYRAEKNRKQNDKYNTDPLYKERRLLAAKESYQRRRNDPEYRRKKIENQRASRAKNAAEWNKKTREYSQTPRGRYVRARTAAIRTRSLVWDIGFEQYVDLIKSGKCHYCTQPISRGGSGLDRKDNNIGYIVDNVVPCCHNCNRTKSAYYTYDEFLLIAAAIRQIHQKRREQSCTR